jgi:hypothetical protein
MNRRVVLIFVVGAALGCSTAARRQDFHIEFCNIGVPGYLKWANASFGAYCTFQVDRQGRPRDIKVEREEPLEEGAYVECVRRWVLSGIPEGTEVQAHFRWTHGVGWEYLEVRYGGSLIRIDLSGDRCPYQEFH